MKKIKQEIIIEIPRNTNVKYEIVDGKLRVDRILFGAMFYPMDYGFFEETLDWDGDPLDALLIANNNFVPGVIVPVRIIGAMKMIDGQDTDTKIICVIDVDPRFNHIEGLKDISPHLIKELRDFFENYKNLQTKKVQILGFENAEYALKELEETRELYKKYHNLSKEEFIKKMRKEFPKKYLNE